MKTRIPFVLMLSLLAAMTLLDAVRAQNPVKGRNPWDFGESGVQPAKVQPMKPPLPPEMPQFDPPRIPPIPQYVIPPKAEPQGTFSRSWNQAIGAALAALILSALGAAIRWRPGKKTGSEETPP